MDWQKIVWNWSLPRGYAKKMNQQNATDIFLFTTSVVLSIIHIRRTRKRVMTNGASKPKGYDIRASFIKNAMNNTLTYKQKIRNHMISKLFVEVVGVKLNDANYVDIADFMNFFKQYVYAMKQRYVVVENEEDGQNDDDTNAYEVRDNFFDYAVEI
jgi:hypothetical protein